MDKLLQNTVALRHNRTGENASRDGLEAPQSVIFRFLKLARAALPAELLENLNMFGDDDTRLEW